MVENKKNFQNFVQESNSKFSVLTNKVELLLNKTEQDFKSVNGTTSTTEQVYGVWRHVTTKKAGIIWVRPPL